MRLIDADTLFKDLAFLYTINHIPVDMKAKEVLRTIMEQPTAYDIDKVVEELGKTMQDLSVIEILSHIDFDSAIQNGLDNFLKAYNSELLRIVKQGGVGKAGAENE